VSAPCIGGGSAAKASSAIKRCPPRVQAQEVWLQLSWTNTRRPSSKRARRTTTSLLAPKKPGSGCERPEVLELGWLLKRKDRQDATARNTEADSPGRVGAEPER
jgi:hypothetical protein